MVLTPRTGGRTFFDVTVPWIRSRRLYEFVVLYVTLCTVSTLVTLAGMSRWFEALCNAAICVGWLWMLLSHDRDAVGKE